MRSSKTIHVVSAHAEGEVGDVNLLVPPRHPEAQAAWIIMELEDTPPTECLWPLLAQAKSRTVRRNGNREMP